MDVKVGGEGAIDIGIFPLGVADDELLAGDGCIMDRKLRHAALAGLARLGEDVTDADGMQAAEDSGGHQFRIVGDGADEGEAAVWVEMRAGEAGDVGHGEGVLVTGHGAAFIGGFQRGVVEGRIADDEVVGLVRLLFKFLQGQGQNRDVSCPRRIADVLGSLLRGIPVNFHRINLEIYPCFGCSLCQHEGDDASSGSYVEYGKCAFCIWSMTRDVGPGTQQYPIGAHLHGASILLDRELLELERTLFHHFCS